MDEICRLFNNALIFESKYVLGNKQNTSTAFERSSIGLKKQAMPQNSFILFFQFTEEIDFSIALVSYDSLEQILGKNTPYGR